MKKLRVLDLFSGIGGFSLGLERAGGFETVAFCEIEDYPRRVLAKHWPGVPCYDDVRTLTADRLAADGIAVDVICGGFPCQDVSFAGKRAGLEGARSGLWREYARLIGELRPQFVIVENVPGLLNLGMGAVLGDLSSLGYDAVWDCVPASAVGAPHRRDRVWIIAHTNDQRTHRGRPRGARRDKSADVCVAVPDADCWNGEDSRRVHSSVHRQAAGVEERSSGGGGRWASWQRDSEPDVGRVAHGVPKRVDRLKGLGNAVVPQVVEIIGRAILNAHMHNMPGREANNRVPQQERPFEAAE